MPRPSITAAPCGLSGAGAPGTEIEITPEMIEVGLAVLLNFDSRFERETWVVEDIYRSMEAARVKGDPS